MVFSAFSFSASPDQTNLLDEIRRIISEAGQQNQSLETLEANLKQVLTNNTNTFNLYLTVMSSLRFLQTVCSLLPTRDVSSPELNFVHFLLFFQAQISDEHLAAFLMFWKSERSKV
jgi:hypothetical protein